MKNLPKSKLANPAAAATIITSKEGKEIITKFQNNQREAINIGGKILMALGTAGLVWYGAKKFKEWQRQKFIEENAHLPDVQAAMIMRKAMFRVELNMWPFGSISIPDGTNEAALFQLASKVTSVENVIEAYKIMFDSNLAVDVAEELNVAELIEFWDNINSKTDYDAQFNPNGSIKPQTPYQIGATIKVINPKGATIFKAGENANGSYYNTNKLRDFKDFNDTVGDIIAVYKGSTTKQYYYVVDMAWSIDTIYGYGWVAHTQVKPE